MTSSEENAEDKMTLDERMAYLRERGIEITTPEERRAAVLADNTLGGGANNPESQQGPPVNFVLIPADTSKPLQQLSFNPPRLGAGGVGTSDPLAVHLKIAFRGKSDQVDLSLLEKHDGAAHLLGSEGSPLSVSDSTLREVAAQGNVEVFSLVHPTATNMFTGVNIYLDEVGMLKRLPLNQRASDYALRAGFNPPPQFFGDVFLCRVQSRPCVRNLSMEVGPDTAFDAPWLQQAATENLEYQMEMNRLTGRNDTQASIAGQDGKEKVEESGYAWTQTEQELEIVVGLPVEAISKDIQVKFSPQLIKVDYRKDTKVVLKLFQRIDVDSGT